jgi:DNA repair protein RadC
MQTTIYPTSKLKYLSIHDRPVARVSADPSVCTVTELLAAIIGGSNQIEIAESLLARFNGDLHRMRQASAAELLTIPGIGECTTAALRAAFTLSSRLKSVEHIEINGPSDLAKLCEDMSAFDQEHLRVIMLNTRNRVLGMEDVYKGSVNMTQIRTGELFRPAIRLNASAVAFAHNHPSGLCDVSPDDVAVTRALVQAGKLLETEVLDHLVIGHGKWTSLKQKGLGF